MGTIRKTAARLVAVAMTVTLTTAMTATAAHASTTPWDGCPSQAACLYTGLDPYGNQGSIIYIWWQGVYKIYNIYGPHLILNNQTDNWVVDLCVDGNGQNCVETIDMDHGEDYNFTPINSVRLHPR